MVSTVEIRNPVTLDTLLIDALETEIMSVREEADTREKACRRQIAEARHRIEMFQQGMNPGQLELAQSVITIQGNIKETAEGALQAAIVELAKGGEYLLKKYIGAKRYDGFHQREDHKYNMGPRHGSIVFAVALTDEVRKRACPPDTLPLTPEEREAAVRWLRAEAAAAGVNL